MRKKQMTKIVKSIALTVVAFAIAATMCACGGGEADYDPLEGVETITFTDDCGREVEIPKTITKAAPSGSVA